jgi:peptidoglycan/xylan/chitin deacetylase (PgdA/CDA1 family)
MSLRQTMLVVFKALGGFALARMVTRRGLRIICYHGISLRDEHCFQPKLFIRENTFRERMAYLKRHGYPILPLDEALNLMYRGELPSWAAVITFDDGWLGIGTKAAPVLVNYGFPSTLYVTTKDVVNEMPVFDVALRYLLWKGREKVLDSCFLNRGSKDIDLSSPAQRERAACDIDEAVKSFDDRSKQDLLLKLAQALDVDWNSDDGSQLFRLMTADQLAPLPGQGMDLQLHTHHHCMPLNDQEGVESEITANRATLARIVDGPFQHFCYPSGEFHPMHFPWLRALGIESATTCLAGFNYPNTDRLELRRFLDGENITQVEFEAEISGFLELMRGLRRIIRQR